MFGNIAPKSHEILEKFFEMREGVSTIMGLFGGQLFLDVFFF